MKLAENDVNNFLGNYNLLIKFIWNLKLNRKLDEVKSLVDKTEEKLIDLNNQEKIDDIIIYNYYVSSTYQVYMIAGI
ncbi:hypothetical protein WG909_06335 [Peptostreptococcaceae bacterium AGR-M142]